ncbi:MAG: 50S ribosomal protein L4 [Planctomycetes bacterium]|nr:50S ribosomal protein L4 [Planctomycetota bacterium]
MLEVPVFNVEGRKIDALKIDEKVFGGEVNVSLLKQAVVTYRANKRQGTAATKSRGMVEGSTRKLYKQKHTGNARRGQVRTNIMKGGGVAFAKTTRDFRKGFPKNMRKAALDSAILAKMLGQNIMVVDGLKVDAPKTARMSEIMGNLNVNRSCLLTIADLDRNVYLSARNIPNLTVRVAKDLNAYDVAVKQKMVVTSDAMKAMLACREVRP